MVNILPVLLFRKSINCEKQSLFAFFLNFFKKNVRKVTQNVLSVFIFEAQS